MKFGAVPLSKATGAVLAHSTAGLKKGRRLTNDDIEHLKANGLSQIIVLRLDKSDVPEDEAAQKISNAAAGPGTEAQAPFTGRANIYAKAAGLVVIDETLLLKLNRIHEAITVACLKSHEIVAKRQMLATVKIIPYAAPKAAVAKALKLLKAMSLVQLAPFKSRDVGLIITKTPHSKPSLIAKSETAIATRLVSRGSRLSQVSVCAHEVEPIAAAIVAQVAQGCSPVLIFGAAAIVDRLDVVPAALTAAKGRVLHLGMPVDPGNLLMLGRLAKTYVIGVPTCARSPKINGFDRVINRLCAGLGVSPQEIMAMGAGGLLAEIASRPQPREGSAPPLKPHIAAVVLAAGLSSRMGTNKLLADLHGKALIAKTVEQVHSASVDEVIVVTGHQAVEMQDALRGKAVRFVHNANYSDGLASSIRVGVEAANSFDAVFIILGDMPLVRTQDLQRMMSAFNIEEGRTLIAPVQGRKLGNPILWGREYFAAMMNLSGDRGARSLLESHRDDITEIAVENDGIMRDADTPEALAHIRAMI